ncbi:MAG: hypothetical protein R3D33_15785 [Hyphomicrobiaceae bacterium]
MTSTVKFLIAGLAAMACLATTAAFAADETFNSPSINGSRLDWCRSWASDCGQPAADAYCQLKGYERATGFAMDADIGGHSPTRIISNPAQVCSDPNCDGFSYINCYKASPEQTFMEPRISGSRLDWCLSWASNCGKPAADAFCRANGFAKASSFQMDADIGGHSPTRIISNPAQVCSDPNCDGFSQITCTN